MGAERGHTPAYPGREPGNSLRLREGRLSVHCGASDARRLDQLIEPRRADGNFVDTHVIIAERLLDAGDNCGSRRYGAGLTDAFDAERIFGAWIHDKVNADGRDFGRGRQQIIGKTRRHRLSVATETHPLEQRITDAMNGAAVDLSLGGLGLITRPQSFTTTYLSRLTLPVRGSTSSSTACTPTP